MKTVGVLLRKYDLNNSFGYYATNVNLLSFLRNYPVKVIGIFIDIDKETNLDLVKQVIDDCDGVILPGGKHHSLIEYDLITYLHQVDKPTFGICLGMQYMGKTFNGHVTKQIPNHNDHVSYAHKVFIDKSSLLFQIIGKEEIAVNTLHSYHLPDNYDYKPLDIVARSDDGIIEGIEDKSKKFFIGVQWHPEVLLEDENSKKLFDYFVSKL